MYGERHDVTPVRDWALLLLQAEEDQLQQQEEEDQQEEQVKRCAADRGAVWM